MKKGQKRLASLLLAMALCVSMLAVPVSAAGAVTPWKDNIGGKTAQIVTVDMVPGRTGQIGLANNSVVESAETQTILDGLNAQPNTQVVAAINGGFFNSYSKGAWVFPDNCPVIMNAVVKDGQLVHTGNTAMLGFTPEGKAMVDWVSLRNAVKLSNGFELGCWSVNTFESDPEAIMLFDEHLTLPVNLPASSTMFYIENGKITKAVPGTTLTVPANTKVLVYNAGILQIEKGYSRAPEVGMTAQVILRASGTNRDSAWETVENALVGGPVLVKNGANVVNAEGNQSFYGDPKQRPDAVNARAFVGVTANGSLVMGTASASFNQIADWMVKNGIQEGVAMDGGASSMLYANGSFLTKAGRPLASVLAIVDRADPNQPSAWAAGEIQSAVSAGLVPQDIQSAYTAPITRQDFCRLIWQMLKQQPGIDQQLQSKEPVRFTDTSDEAVLNCARLGIVSGAGQGLFEPGRNLKRSEAAKILALTTQLLGAENSGTQKTFSDQSSFGWAEEFIQFCAANGIMNGEGAAFNPNGTFSREQAIATVLRIRNNYGK